jgi:diaminohydroxyphosphoribosylaminopyrimidine deaminase/5-amino-6-(5-phosphoribosylamino)uracil reductase
MKTRSRGLDRSVLEHFMSLALEEARKGLGTTSPNPAVGAVIVKDGRVVARGHHVQAGGPHAEVVALRRAGRRARGADLYSTLEPCNHQGRTPPCTEALLAAGVKRVIVACRDLNPLVSGTGIRRLRSAGIPVVVGPLAEKCRELNVPFFTYITEKRPFVTLKIAATADGKIATATGDSRWVTGPQARQRVHDLRQRVDAILVGASTIRADNPQLTARPGGKLGPKQPLRVVLTSSLDLPPTSRVFENAAPGQVLVLTSRFNRARAAALEARGARVVRLGTRGKRASLKAVLRYLASQEVVHLLVEGGADLFGQFLEERLADRVLLFIAPKILGEGLSWANLEGRHRMSQAIALSQAEVERIGNDVLIAGALQPAWRKGAGRSR